MGKKRIDKKHSFNVIIAEKYTVQKALIIEEILNWCEYNKLKKQNFFSGKYWTRRTAKEYHKQFPYMNEKSIDRWLKELVEDGILYVGKFNKKKFDKTNWHCVNLLKYNQILYVPQNEESTPQNEVCVPQNEVCVPQNEETIPTPNINSLSKEYGECVNTQKHTLCQLIPQTTWETRKKRLYWLNSVISSRMTLSGAMPYLFCSLFASS